MNSVFRGRIIKIRGIKIQGWLLEQTLHGGYDGSYRGCRELVSERLPWNVQRRPVRKALMNKISPVTL